MAKIDELMEHLLKNIEAPSVKTATGVTVTKENFVSIWDKLPKKMKK